MAPVVASLNDLGSEHPSAVEVILLLGGVPAAFGHVVGVVASLLEECGALVGSGGGSRLSRSHRCESCAWRAVGLGRGGLKEAFYA